MDGWMHRIGSARRARTGRSRGGRRLAGRVLAALCALTVGLSSSAIARADDGLWYLDQFGVRDAHAQGLDGSGVTISVIDSPLVSDYPALSDANISYDTVPQSTRAPGGRSEGYDACYQNGQKIVASFKSGQAMDPDAPGDPIFITHGTEMTSRIVGNGKGYGSDPGFEGIAPRAAVKFFANSGGIGSGDVADNSCEGPDGSALGTDLATTGLGIARAVGAGARVVSMSFLTSVDADDYPGFLSALQHGVIMVSARDNSQEPGLPDMVGDPSRLTGLPGLVTVNSIGPSGPPAPSSDTTDGSVAILSPGNEVLIAPAMDTRVLDVANGGTSSAVANLSGMLTLALQKWPDATGNQIMQSLVANTRDSDGTATLDEGHERGFGVVDLTKLLAVDPTGYPDVNPILDQEVTRAAEHGETADMYDAQCAADSAQTTEYQFGDVTMKVPCQAGQFKQELVRQQDAWAAVQQCRADGGADCMRLSATNTAPAVSKQAGAVQAPAAPVRTSTHAGVWVAAATGALAVVAVATGGVILHRRRRSSH
ncbi:Putative thermostable alkaline protease [Propionibacterium freudenreichii]|nr:Putative thermostable alkaline protease [Propionibacterium freudenreichii]SCQ71242.1 Putative thermostable alkaline protease [Propionibacterium freudenreichii]